MSYSKRHRILYVGPLRYGGTCLQRFQAFVDLGHIVFPFDIDLYFSPAYRGVHSIEKKLNFGPSLLRMNRDIVKQAKKYSIDICWFDKSTLVFPNTLNKLKKILKNSILIHYSPDDMINPDNQTSNYLKSISLFDVHITTKSYQVNELAAMGAQKTLFLDNAYCHHLHRPIKVNDDDREQYGAAVAFIGSFEEDRYESIRQVAEAGIEVRIWGEGWKRKALPFNENIKIENRAIWGAEYVIAICSTDINLCFLRKANRDLQTTRSVEIPACGAFMIAERTNEHLRLFKEGDEAVYFSSNEELVRKILHYQARPEQRLCISRAALKRCEDGGYNNVNRLAKIIQEVTAVPTSKSNWVPA